MDVRVAFSDSRSKRSRDIRTAHFVMDDRRRRTRPPDAGHHIRQNAIVVLCLKIVSKSVPKVCVSKDVTVRTAPPISGLSCF